MNEMITISTPLSDLLPALRPHTTVRAYNTLSGDYFRRMPVGLFLSLDTARLVDEGICGPKTALDIRDIAKTVRDHMAGTDYRDVLKRDIDSLRKDLEIQQTMLQSLQYRLGQLAKAVDDIFDQTKNA